MAGPASIETSARAGRQAETLCGIGPRGVSPTKQGLSDRRPFPDHRLIVNGQSVHNGCARLVEANDLDLDAFAAEPQYQWDGETELDPSKLVYVS